MPVRYEGTTAALTDKSWNSRLISAGCRQVCITTDQNRSGFRGGWLCRSCCNVRTGALGAAELPK
jgi:hypothetical protein